MSDREAGVCVIIAAFNAQKTISRAVGTALLQDGVREVIVADDCSQDDTARLAQAQDDGSGRLCVFTMPANAGPAAARNAALTRTHSPYLCMLDGDDYFLPERISRLLNAAAGVQWDMIADDILIVPEDRQQHEFSIVNPDPLGACRALGLESFVRGNISNVRRPRDELGFLKPIIKVEFLRRHGLRYDERFRLGEDYALYTRALIAGARFYLANTCGYIAVERDDSISSRHAAEDLKKIADFDKECLEVARLSNSERAALKAHYRGTIHKYNHRLVLDYKRDRGLLAALGLLARMPASISSIASETIRAKTMRALGQLGRGEVGRAHRFLVGMPDARILLDS
jgi:succinoglycan biosynthesis protein ExoU